MKKFFLFFNFSVLLLACVSCGNDNEPSSDNWRDYAANYNAYSDIYEQLANTTWELTSVIENKTGKSASFATSYIGESITFTTDINTHGFMTGSLKSYASFYPNGGFGQWLVRNDGTLNWIYCCEEHTNITTAKEGGISLVFGNGGEIVTLNSSTLKIESGIYTYTYKASSYSGGGSSSGGNNSGDDNGGGGSSNGYEKPEIGIEDWTAGLTNLTIYYRIYNQDKAKVSSATGYYGTSSASSSVSATVAGSRIQIVIRNLKKGTTYYVKCKATGPGGSTTSEQTRITTLSQ